MKKWIHASEEFNYGSHYIIGFVKDQGWVIYEYGKIIAGPFRSWTEAQDYIDRNLED